MGKHQSTFAEKVEWMARHYQLWKGWPTKARLTDDQLKLRMVEAGLISKGSHSYDIMDFGRLVAAARTKLGRWNT